MKILMVNEKGAFFGGVEQLLNDLSGGLAERGHEVGLLRTESLAPGQRPLDAPFSRVWQLEGGAAGVERVLDEARPEVVYVHRCDAAVLGSLLGRARLIRYIHDHDVYCPRRHKYFPWSQRICEHPMGAPCVLHGCLLGKNPRRSWLPTWIDLGQKKELLRLHHRIGRLCVGSRWMRQALLTNGIEAERVSILPPVPRGLEREPFPVSDSPEILFVGQLVRGKGVDLLLRALAQLRSSFRASIVGVGNHLEECRRLCRELGLEERVRFEGWVAHEALEPYYRRARVVVVPSRWPEPFGMVGLEAMWAARPVVAFAVGGIPDWLEAGVTGFLAPEQDCAAFARSLDVLLQDAGRAGSMGLAGHRRASEHYTFESQIRATEALLIETAGVEA